MHLAYAIETRSSVQMPSFNHTAITMITHYKYVFAIKYMKCAAGSKGANCTHFVCVCISRSKSQCGRLC